MVVATYSSSASLSAFRTMGLPVQVPSTSIAATARTVASAMALVSVQSVPAWMTTANIAGPLRAAGSQFQVEPITARPSRASSAASASAVAVAGTLALGAGGCSLLNSPDMMDVDFIMLACVSVGIPFAVFGGLARFGRTTQLHRVVRGIQEDLARWEELTPGEQRVTVRRWLHAKIVPPGGSRSLSASNAKSMDMAQDALSGALKQIVTCKNTDHDGIVKEFIAALDPRHEKMGNNIPYPNALVHKYLPYVKDETLLELAFSCAPNSRNNVFWVHDTLGARKLSVETVKKVLEELPRAPQEISDEVLFFLLKHYDTAFSPSLKQEAVRRIEAIKNPVVDELWMAKHLSSSQRRDWLEQMMQHYCEYFHVPDEGERGFFEVLDQFGEELTAPSLASAAKALRKMALPHLGGGGMDREVESLMRTTLQKLSPEVRRALASALEESIESWNRYKQQKREAFDEKQAVLDQERAAFDRIYDGEQQALQKLKGMV